MSDSSHHLAGGQDRQNDNQATWEQHPCVHNTLSTERKRSQRTLQGTTQNGRMSMESYHA
jgi:hypothetical protein